MKEVNVLEALRQASLSEVGQVFQEEMRGIIKESFISLMFEEARQLCGGFYHPDAASGYSKGEAQKACSRSTEVKSPSFVPEYEKVVSASMVKLS